VRVQHHLAHAAAVLGEHRRFPGVGAQASAIVLDGTGFGPGGDNWGAEWLVISGDLTWKRVSSARPLPLVGGERAIREPWRVAVAALRSSASVDDLPPRNRRFEAARGRCGARPAWGSAGEWWDDCSKRRSVAGLCVENTYEGEAAARFGSAGVDVRTSRCALDGRPNAPPAPELPSHELLRALAQRVRSKLPLEQLALDFHVTFCALAAELAERELPHDAPVALAGGCFVNRLLLEGLRSELRQRGFEVLVPERLPPGDGGLAFGQIVVASAATALSTLPVFQGDCACASRSR
jgi:hydrogenase maturation protein HypF